MVIPKRLFRRRQSPFAFLVLAFLSLLLLVGLSRQRPRVVARKIHEQNRAGDVSNHRDQTENARSAATAALMNLPLSFEPADGANQFLVRGAGYRLRLTSSQVTLAVNGRASAKPLGLKLGGANVDARVVALDPLPGKRNYLLGNDPAK